jgi:vancomycin aglycone glucosyltransferase
VLWDRDAQTVNALFGETLNRHRASIGLPPVTGGVPASRNASNSAGSGRSSGRSHAPVRTTSRLYVGFGSMALRGGADIVWLAIEAIRKQGRRALLSQRWADLAPIDDRDDCFAVGEINQQALLGRVAAVVHHGGAGTTTTAARAGAPQLVVPQGADQVYWAHRVAELGIGTAYDGRTATPESLSAALETTLAPETRTRAGAVAGTIRTDGAIVAARLLINAIS